MRAPNPAALGLLALACSSPLEVRVAAPAAPMPPEGPAAPAPPEPSPPVVGSLAATPLAGPFAGRDEACAALGKAAGVAKPSCRGSAVKLGPGAPFAEAELLLVMDAGNPDPRLRDAGATHLAVRVAEGWFAASDPLDQVNSGAGRTFIPTLTPMDALVARHPGAPARVVVRARDETGSICNVCDPPARDRRVHVRVRQRAAVCSTIAGGRPACTPAVELHEQAVVTLSGRDVLAFTQPETTADGAKLAPRGAYPVTF
jgi:hypothetical protein